MAVLLDDFCIWEFGEPSRREQAQPWSCVTLLATQPGLVSTSLHESICNLNPSDLSCDQEHRADGSFVSRKNRIDCQIQAFWQIMDEYSLNNRCFQRRVDSISLEGKDTNSYAKWVTCAWPTTCSDTLDVLLSQLGVTLTRQLKSLQSTPAPVSLILQQEEQPARCKQPYLFSHYSRLPYRTNEAH